MKKTSGWWLALALAVAGCSAKKHLTEDQYFRNATEHFRGGALNLAIDDYHEMLDQYPFSEHNEEAELKIAHAQYLDGSYPEAVAALTDFQRRHPTSPQLPLVGYYLGMCYVRQMGTIDRDQTAARNAQTYFQTVVQQYPDSPFADLAHQQLGRCQESLAAHELYVAKFYDRQGNTKAAEIRLLMLASRYGESDVAIDGLMRLAQIYRKQQEDEYEVLAYRALTQLHPRAPEAATANRAIEQLASVEVPATGDPIDQLLAANGRQRSTGVVEPVTVPGIEPGSSTRRGPAAAPMAPPMDPFGRGRGRRTDRATALNVTDLRDRSSRADSGSGTRMDTPTIHAGGLAGHRAPTARERLSGARVAIIGAGGLGAPAAVHLAAAGVGTVALVDGDVVDLSNLHRQVLYRTTDLARRKVAVAAQRLAARYPDVTVETHDERLSADTLADLFAGCDFIIDATDHVTSKYLINDGQHRDGIPFSHAGVVGFQGQTMTVVPGPECMLALCVRNATAGGRDSHVPQEAGVIGALAGTFGVLQAAEALKFLLGTGALLTDRLLACDALTGRWRTIHLSRTPQCPLCGDQPWIGGVGGQSEGD